LQLGQARLHDRGEHCVTAVQTGGQAGAIAHTVERQTDRALRIGIHEQSARPAAGEGVGAIERGGGLADPTLETGECNG